MSLARKRPTNLSISEDVLADARRHGINLSEIAEAALRQEIDKRDRESLQARMDRSMARWNDFDREGLTVADEFSSL